MAPGGYIIFWVPYVYSYLKGKIARKPCWISRNNVPFYLNEKKILIMFYSNGIDAWMTEQILLLKKSFYYMKSNINFLFTFNE